MPGLGVSLTGIQAYASAKAALIGLTRQLAHELGPFGITVNSVAPGFVRSNPATERQWEAYGRRARSARPAIALKRLGTPEDIAHAVLFFASDYAGWISGQLLRSTAASERRRGYSRGEFEFVCRGAEGVLRDPVASAPTRPMRNAIGEAARISPPTGSAAPDSTGSRRSQPSGIRSSWRNGSARPARQPIVVYGHYDVQPRPIEQMADAAFQADSARKERLYARGASDDKGPLLIPILVAEAFLKVRGALPLNLKMLIEGEEEIGSPSFEPAV